MHVESAITHKYYGIKLTANDIPHIIVLEDSNICLDYNSHTLGSMKESLELFFPSTFSTPMTNQCVFFLCHLHYMKVHF